MKLIEQSPGAHNPPVSHHKKKTTQSTWLLPLATQDPQKGFLDNDEIIGVGDGKADWDQIA